MVRDSRPGGQGGGGGALLVALGAFGLLGYGGYELLKPKPGSSGGAAGFCQGCASGSSSLAPGLYVDCADPTNPATCSIWRVGPDGTGKMVRYGYPTPKQLARCEGANPTIIGPNFSGFGDGDSASFIGTVQDISATCPCPPGSPGA